MEGVLIAGIVLAVFAAAFLATRVNAANAAAERTAKELESMRARLSAAESEARRSSEGLEAKRREVEELKEKLRDVKKKRFDEKEAAKARRDVEEARLQVEREWEKKLAVAREEAEEARSQARRLQAEVDALKSRRPQATAAVEQGAPAAAAGAAAEPRYRELSPEEKAKLEAAQRELAKTKKKLEETEHELRKARGRSETDRRVYTVQKGELELAKDRFRTLEARYNELMRDHDGVRNALWALEQELKALRSGEAASEAVVPAVPAPEATEVASAKPEEAPQAVEVASPAEPGSAAEGEPAKA